MTHGAPPQVTRKGLKYTLCAFARVAHVGRQKMQLVLTRLQWCTAIRQHVNGTDLRNQRAPLQIQERLDCVAMESVQRERRRRDFASDVPQSALTKHQCQDIHRVPRDERRHRSIYQLLLLQRMLLVFGPSLHTITRIRQKTKLQRNAVSQTHSSCSHRSSSDRHSMHIAYPMFDVQTYVSKHLSCEVNRLDTVFSLDGSTFITISQSTSPNRMHGQDLRGMSRRLSKTSRTKQKLASRKQGTR